MVLCTGKASGLLTHPVKKCNSVSHYEKLRHTTLSFHAVPIVALAYKLEIAGVHCFREASPSAPFWRRLHEKLELQVIYISMVQPVPMRGKPGPLVLYTIELISLAATLEAK